MIFVIIVTVGMLIISSIQDIKTQEAYHKYIYPVLIFNILFLRTNLVLTVGVFILLYLLMCLNKIGGSDVLIFAAMTPQLGYLVFMVMGVASWLLLIYIIITKKYKEGRELQVAFIPAITMGYIICVCLLEYINY